MQTAFTQKAVRPVASAAAPRTARTSSVKPQAAAARNQVEKKQQNAALLALAGFTAAVLMSAAPAPAVAAVDEAKVRAAVCASMPTSKLCLSDTAKTTDKK